MPIYVNDRVTIPDDALTFTASRSSGPGGQHVNKTSSRVTLRVDLRHGLFLGDDDRRLVLERLGARLDADGTLRVVCQSSRSQAANKRIASERLATLLAEALEPPVPRVPTRVPKGSKSRRRDVKRRRSDVKRLRRGPDDES